MELVRIGLKLRSLNSHMWIRVSDIGPQGCSKEILIVVACMQGSLCSWKVATARMITVSIVEKSKGLIC